VAIANTWAGLLANLAIVAVVALAWAHVNGVMLKWPRLARSIVNGIAMGGSAVLVLQAAIELRPGFYLDLRTVPIALAGVVAGPIAATVAVVIASMQRLLIGGGGTVGGIGLLALVGVLSALAYAFRRRRPLTFRFLLGFGALLSLISTGGVFIATASEWETYLGPVLVPIALLVFMSFVIGGTILMQGSRQLALMEALEKNRALFGHALAEMSDGIAMFDSNKRLVFCNQQYLGFFPRTREARVPGAPLREILRRVVDSGEQIGRPQSEGDAWIEETVALLDAAGEEEVQLFDGRWLSIRTRPAADGSCMVVVSDLTRHKKDQRALREMTERLQLLASTDGLTGIGNRRAFDAALAREADVAARTMQPLSLLLVDIDWFKSFNDEYGHLIGDRCLRAIAHTLRAVVNDPSDLVSRFGGEEFVALLPGTDSEGAVRLSEAFARTLHARAIEHAGSPKRIVTASVGVGTWVPAMGEAALSNLVRDADIALYRAKSSGRDMICTKERVMAAIAGAA
jgi:diguanylate cyclase (GGDEF)-like protein